MAGGLMQLVAKGAQDAYLTGNPETTFFKVMYRRHTDFALESIEQTFNGTPDFGKRVSTTISRNGDLVKDIVLQVDLPTLTGSGTQAWTRHVGHNLIKQCEIKVGGQQIDRQYGQWMQIWSELTLTKEQEDNFNVMIGNTSTLTTAASSIAGETLYIPLQFWFCRSPGLALPLISLQYHEVVIDIEFRRFDELVIVSSGTATSASLGNVSLWVDYVYLDNDERRKFAQIAHEYLITQLQFTGAESFNNTAVRQKINFNHPCKEFVWVLQLDANVDSGANRWTDFTNGSTAYNGGDVLVDAKLQLNGQDRFATRKAGYFNNVQPYQHHTRGPATGIYVYSLALKPEEQQPSGSVNMSRIDNATLQMTMASNAAGKSYVYARNYNVFRVMSGMGGLAYSA